MYYLEVYAIDGCPYCDAAKNLIMKHKVPTKLFRVMPQDKPKYKALHGMNTFPHIFKVENGNRSKVGG